MIKKKKKKDNIIKFPPKLSFLEKEIEAIVFAAAEPLDIETIEGKISKKADVEKDIKKLQIRIFKSWYKLSLYIKKMVF